MSQHEHIRLTYDGPALETHTMDVRMLAPALLAFGDLAEETGRTLFGDDLSVRTEVKASFKSGSFGIDLSVATNMAQQKILNILSSRESTAVANAYAILSALGIIGGAGLIQVIKRIRGRTIKRIEPIEGKERVIITLEDKETIEVEENVVRLLRSHAVRLNLQRVIEPVEQDGIDKVAFGDDSQISIIITKEEAPLFRAPDPSERVIQDDVRVIPFSIVTVSCREGNKWRLHDGQNTVNVSIEDEAFLEQINRGTIRFGKGDIIEAETHILSIQTKDGLKTEYTILKVVKYIPSLNQIDLPIDG